jgi:hypothetical protein
MALRKVGGLGKFGAETPITVPQIVETMGLDDALWCLRTIPEHNNRWRLLAVRYARRVRHLMTDTPSHAALEVAERYARGLASEKEIAAARAAAKAAIYLACGATNHAAAKAALASCDDNPAVEAGTAAYAAVRAYARAAPGEDTYAAEAAERAWQSEELIRICNEAKP